MIPELSPEKDAALPVALVEGVKALKDGLIAWRGDIPVVMKGSKLVADVENMDLQFPEEAILQLQEVWDRY